jgi:translation initiation factor IF-1
MFREGKTKMLGEVVEMFNNEQVQAQLEKNPRAKPEE